jgi:PKHD-type hydroxylase
MNGEWCVFDKKFSKEYCESIVAEANTLPRQSGALGVAGQSEIPNWRKSQIAFIQRDMTKWTQVFDDIWKLVCEANNSWFNFHISKFDYIQFAEYNSDIQGEYKRHHDVFYMNGDPFYHRKLSAVIQLTDPAEYDGGDFEMYGIDSQVPKNMFRNQGSVIVFPSFVEHAALPVTRGVRHSLAIWVDGPKWR